MKPVLAKYIGTQHSGKFGSFRLYNLLEPIEGHPIHSTVSLNTLTMQGLTPVEVREVPPEEIVNYL